MKTMRELTKKFVVHLMIFSLVQTSFPYQTANAQASVQSNPVLQIAQTAMGLYGQMLGQKQQIVMQQIQAQKNQQMMQQLSPNCRKPDGTSCFTVPGKLFPECPLPASMSNMPENVCSAATPDPGAISSMITYEAISKSWINYYDQMSNEASNSAVPFGLKCLEDKQKAVDSQITEMINNLTRLQDRLNQDKQVFRDNNKKILEDLAVTNAELFGNGKNDIGLKTMDPAKFFSNSCQSAIGKDALTKSSGFVGFNGILDIMSAKAKPATDFIQNKNSIESDIRRDIERMQNGIRTSGLGDWMNNIKGPLGADLSSMATVKNAAAKQLMEFETSYARIAGELKKEYDYEAPKLDKNFSADFEEFLGESKNYFKKKYINECVTGADKGIAIPVDKLLEGMTTKIKGVVGEGYLRDYRQAYKNIVESGKSVEDIDQELKALSAKYPQVVLRYQDSKSAYIIESPYQTFMKTAEKCAANYTFNQQKKVDRGQTLLRELQGLHDNFASNLGQAVLEKTLNCNGEAKKAGGTCSEESLNYKSEGFCMAQANDCANEIQGCYAEASKQVDARKAKMATIAAKYNKSVEGLVARSNALYEQQKNAVIEMTKVIQAKFPGTNFAIPEGLFISMPEMKKDTYGIELANDGNLSFMDELPKKIGLLKNVFEEQKEKANATIEEYIAKQKMAMDREKNRWSQLASECKGNIDSASSKLAQMNAEGQKKQAEIDGKVASFCSRYSDLRDNPMPSCDDAKKLAEDADKISAHLSGGARQVTREFRNACNSVNNEKDVEFLDDDCSEKKNKTDRSACEKRKQDYIRKLSIEDQEKSKPVKLSSLCGVEGDKEDKDFLANVAKKVPEDEKIIGKATTIKDVLKKGDELESAEFFSKISQIVGKENLDKTKVCKRLAEVNEAVELSDSDFKEKNDEITKLKKELIESEAKAKSKRDTEVSKLKKDLADIERKIEAEDKGKSAGERLDSVGKYKAEADPIREKIKLAEQSPEVDELKSKLKLAEADFKESKDKKLLKEALSSLVVMPSKQKVVEEKFDRIGEQASSIPCTAQATNNNMPKMFNSTDFLMQHDQAILGKSK